MAVVTKEMSWMRTRDSFAHMVHQIGNRTHANKVNELARGTRKSCFALSRLAGKFSEANEDGRGTHISNYSR